jgi:transposase-like protein
VTKQRKHFTAAQKAAIVRQHLVDRTAVADLCEAHGIRPTLYYRWQKQVFDGLADLFEQGRPGRPGRPSAQAEEIAQLRARLARKDEVIAEITSDFIDVKKKLGDR